MLRRIQPMLLERPARRRKGGLSFLVTLFVFITPICAADGSNGPILGLPSRYCRSEAPAALQRALCDGDSTAFWRASKDLLESSDTDKRRLTIDVLEKLWRRDRSLGDGLPWTTLYSDDFEAFVVERL